MFPPETSPRPLGGALTRWQPSSETRGSCRSPGWIAPTLVDS
jgi:hypothetical protein